MKTQKLLPLALFAIALSAWSGPGFAKSGLEPQAAERLYDSGKLYGDEDSAGQLYMRRSPGMPWRQLARPQNLNQIRCGEALLALAQQGRWTGNLKSDGTCGDDAEPAEWVTANYLQFQEKRQP